MEQLYKETDGSAPGVTRNGPGRGAKRLFYSVRDIALVKDKQVQAGYGYLEAGTIMAVNASAAGNKGLLVPYVPLYDDVVLGTKSAIGVAALVLDGVSGTVNVSLEDSYKFGVGDELYLENNAGAGPISLGAITEIARTDSRYAVITVGAYTATSATVATSAYVYIKTGAADPFSKAAWLLDKDINTGRGEDAIGAQTSVVISNAIVYKASLVNATAEALTALGAVEDGQHVIIK